MPDSPTHDHVPDRLLPVRTGLARTVCRAALRCEPPPWAAPGAAVFFAPKVKGFSIAPDYAAAASALQ